MRVFLLILIGIVVGSAAGSMTSWFLTKESLPLAVATSNAEAGPGSNAPPREIDAEPQKADPVPGEQDVMPRPKAPPDSLDQQAREMERMRIREEQAQAVATPVEEPTLEPLTIEPTAVEPASKSAPPSNRPAKTTAVPAPPIKEGSGYILPIGIGLIAGIVAFLVANRGLSHDI